MGHIFHLFILLIDFMMSSHDHVNTRSSRKMSLEDAIANLHSDLSEKITNLTTAVRSTKDEVINLNEKSIRRLQDENKLHRAKCSKLENKIVSLESSINQVEQYGRRNNIVISGIPDDISDNDLESTVVDIMKDVDVDINSSDIEACQSKLVNKIGEQQVRKLMFVL